MQTKTIFTAAILAITAAACTPKTDNIKPTKNVIFMITDGTSTSVLSVARWYKRYLTDSMSLALNVDPYICGLVQTHESQAPITCSAPAMSAYMTGVLQRQGNLCIYPEAQPEQDFFPVDTSRTWQPAATVMEAARILNGKATGVAVTVPFCHATPAATCTHAATRSFPRLGVQMASQNLDVVFGGGIDVLTPQIRSILAANGTTLLENDVESFRNFKGSKLWSLYNDDIMDFELDRNPDEQPSLAEMTAKALDILSKDKDGFFLMVEGSMVDFGAHSNDASEIIGDFLAFDEAVKVAMDFARRDGNTTVVICPDHGNSGVVMSESGFPDYENAGLECIFGGLKDIKATSSRMKVLLQECKASEIPEVFRKWTGIELTDEDLSSLHKYMKKIEGDYMQVSNTWNFQRAIGNIYKKHMHLGYSSGNHTAEDVFLAVYNPNGQRPEGIITNVQLNEYLCKVAGINEPLINLTDRLFAPQDKVFAGMECSKNAETLPTLTVRSASSELQIPSNRNIVYTIKDGRRDSLFTDAPAIYMRQNGKFYVDASLGALLK